MSGVPLWAVEAAATFWTAAGEEEGFPRSLRPALSYALPLSVVPLPQLHVWGIERWLRGQGVTCDLRIADRSLRACLIARYDQGFVFLDRDDPPDEQRFSLAHELAHFLRDYWTPRRRAVQRLGESVLEALDGERAPRQDERVYAVLARVSIGVHVHVMERTGEGAFATSVIDKAEREANLLACELLAPSAGLLEQAGGLPAPARTTALAARLRDAYGLPAPAAAQYAALLVPPLRQSGSFVSRLRIVT